MPDTQTLALPELEPDDDDDDDDDDDVEPDEDDDDDVEPDEDEVEPDEDDDDDVVVPVASPQNAFFARPHVTSRAAHTPSTHAAER